LVGTSKSGNDMVQAFIEANVGVGNAYISAGIGAVDALHFGAKLLNKCEATQDGSDIVPKLLAAKVDANYTDAMGRSPLMVSCKHGKLEVVEMLLNARAFINAVDQ